MSNLLRLSAVALVAVFGASVASAQSPGLRSGVRPVTTVSPVPAMQLQQQQMWDNAFRQAQLWQMYQPRVVVMNPVVTNPWGPTVTTNPWGPTITPNPWGPIVTRNPWGPTVTPNPWGPSLYRTYSSPW